jgi:hypothetical protein
MLRTLFLVLLVLNAVLLAWNFNLLAPLGLPALAPAGEPGRLQQQVHPERLQVQPLPEDAQAAPGAAPPAAPDTGEASSPARTAASEAS